MKSYLALGLSVFFLFSLISLSHAAGYMKFDGVDGEAKNTTRTSAPAKELDKSSPKIQETGLLLPAVQKARPASSGKQKGKVETEWKVEEGE